MRENDDVAKWKNGKRTSCHSGYMGVPLIKRNKTNGCFSPSLRLHANVLAFATTRKPLFTGGNAMIRTVRVQLGTSVLALAISTAAIAEAPDRQPDRGPVPSWVKLATIPKPDPAKAEAPYQVLLLEGQTKFGKDGENTYFEMVIRPQTVVGLQGFSTVVLPWNVARSDLTVHAIEAIRDGKPIDLIKGAPFTILRRESRLEQAQFDGVRSVVLPVKGVEIGDIIRISATYHDIPNEITSKPDDLSKWATPFPVGSMDRRVIVPADMPVKWRVGGRAPKPTIMTTKEGTEYRFTASALEPVEFAKNMRARDQADEVQFSGYQDWSEIAGAHVALYEAARKSAANSPLLAEADKIAASTNDPQLRMMAALRLAQDRVRYVAMLLGEGAYRPTVADEAWEARYGDCKAKSALLLALLDRLGIKADPMYVNAQSGDAIADRLPSLETFDHVIVKATIGGKAYYLDATDFGQRVPADVAGSDLEYGLPIAKGATLEKLPPHMAQQPTHETEMVWDGSQGLTGDVPFKARLTLRGHMAILARAKKASAEKSSEFEEFLKNYLPGVENDAFTIASQKDDGASGAYIVEFTGKAEMGWDEYEERKGARFPFSNNASKWDVEFDRKEGPYKDARVVLNPAYWQQQKETVVLPNTKGFKIDDSKPIDRKVAGTHIWRNVSMEGNEVTSVTNFRQLVPDIAADEARAAEDEIEAISNNWAYVVGPRSLKPKD